ncbi:MAG: TonB family protein [Paracoccaceae bacterium]
MTAPFRIPTWPSAAHADAFPAAPRPGLREPGDTARPRAWRRRAPWLLAICLSGAAHVGAVIWAMGAGGPAPEAGEPGEVLAEVRIMPQAEFDAMISSPPRAGAEGPAAPPGPQAGPHETQAPDSPHPDTLMAAVPPALQTPAPEPQAPPSRVPSPPPPVFPSAPAPLADLPSPALAAGIAKPTAPSGDPARAPLPKPAAAPKPDAPPPAAAPAARPAKDTAAGEAGAKAAAAAKRAKSPPPAAAAATSAETAAAPKAGLSEGERQALQAKWGGRIRSRIGRAQDYPAEVLAAGTERRIVLSLTIAPTGRLLSVGLAESSGMAAFDRAVVTAVRRAGRLPRAPEGLDEPSYRFSIGLRFTP